ncbi:MAG: protein translocase subunit SecF, partial [Actinobacteria bacterium]|nr:protein translocase subunit SecF [Actinomycetota bacterium]
MPSQRGNSQRSRRVRAPVGAPVPGDEQPRGSAFARLYRGETNFDFINRWKYWFALSGTVIAVGLVALAIGGLNFSIDFKGGTQWEVPTAASVTTVRSKLYAINPALDKSTITELTSRTTGKKEIAVEAPSSLASDSHLVNQVTDELAKLARVSVDKVNLTAVGPSWGSVITKKAVEAVIVFVVLIVLAMSLYFETKMAFAAFAALVHDMAVTVGIYALSGFQVSPDTVIAFLTVLGYSLYDTIVVFDKVKENTRGLASTNRVTYTDVVNLSMNQVLARSINTSFVSVVPVFCILVIGSWILGASALNDFGLALFIGLMSGAYSSIFIASPVLALLKEREPRYVEIRRRLAAYPQSRQVLTAASVSGGMVVGARSARPSRTEPASPSPAYAGAGSSARTGGGLGRGGGAGSDDMAGVEGVAGDDLGAGSGTATASGELDEHGSGNGH